MIGQESDILIRESQPLVSILMNCYNGEKYLAEAIDSVLGQTYQNWEIVFWDNQSTDNSANIFKSYSDPRLKYFYSPTHTLLYEARNYAIAKTLGTYIAFLDVDDWWCPKKLEFQLQLFDDPEVGFVCSNYFIQNKGKLSLAYASPIPRGNVLDRLLDDYFVGLLTLVIRRDALIDPQSPFDSRYHIIGDFDLVISLSAIWKLGVNQQPLAGYRIHGGNISLLRRDMTVNEMENWYLENLLHPVIGNSKNINYVNYLIMYMKVDNLLLAGDKKEAIKFIWKMPFGRRKLRRIIKLIIPVLLLNFFRKLNLS